jgi:hypothetical protein
MSGVYGFNCVAIVWDVIPPIRTTLWGSTKSQDFIASEPDLPVGSLAQIPLRKSCKACWRDSPHGLQPMVMPLAKAATQLGPSFIFEISSAIFFSI